jgi:hypothetical protein
MAEYRATGRHNMVLRRGTVGRAALGLLLLAVSWVPWLYLPAGLVGLALVASEFVLFAAYAIPPLRLKERGIWGLVADALYAHVIGAWVAWLTFSHLCRVPAPLALGLLIGAWNLATGMRHLLHHQLYYAEQDRGAHVPTFVARHGVTRSRRVIERVFLPVEVSCFAVLLVVLGRDLPLVPIGFALHVAWQLLKMKTGWLPLPKGFVRSEAGRGGAKLGVLFLSGFYEAWLPLLVLLSLGVREREYLALAVLHLVLFRNPAIETIVNRLPLGLGRARRAASA